MNAKASKTVSTLFRDWQAEDRELESVIGSLRAWMSEVNQLGIPHFGETGDRLRSLRQRLVIHFDREDEIIEGLAESSSQAPSELAAMRISAAQDHRDLIERLNDLCGRLSQLEPPFQSWEAAMDEVDSFVHDLDQHEKREFSGVLALVRDDSAG